MLKQSLGSVEITWFDRAAVIRALDLAVRRLARKRPEIQKVILFGSMARGDAVPGSDVDLLVVLSESRSSFLERISRYKPTGIPVGVDVFPYTKEEVAQMVKEGNRFISQAFSEGVLIFQRGSSSTEPP